MQAVADGLAFIYTPNLAGLSDASVWLAAAGQIFCTLSVGMGTLGAYASYLSKRDDIALLFYACRLRAGRDPNEQPPLSDDDRDEEPPPEHLEQWQAAQWPEVQRLRRRRALNQYRLQDLPGPLKESAALRRVAAKGVRRDYRLLESHVHDADWPLKIPITALAGEHDLSVTDKDLQEWETETGW